MERYRSTDLSGILHCMADYAEQCKDNGEDISSYFNEIITTGLFHDAIGKIVNVDKEWVEVTTDY